MFMIYYIFCLFNSKFFNEISFLYLYIFLLFIYFSIIYIFFYYLYIIPYIIFKKLTFDLLDGQFPLST
jgi:hypothetical protein